MHLAMIMAVGLTMWTGCAGMTALKEFRDLGFDVTVFEKRSDVGGVWTWTADPGSTTALRETKLCNNKYSVRFLLAIMSIILTGLYAAYHE
jgi:heterodisulfide reductase subunit A-like polyferredoxin